MEVFEGKVKNKSGKEVTIKVIDEGGILNYQEEVEFVVVNSGKVMLCIDYEVYSKKTMEERAKVRSIPLPLLKV